MKAFELIKIVTQFPSWMTESILGDAVKNARSIEKVRKTLYVLFFLGVIPAMKLFSLSLGYKSTGTFDATTNILFAFMALMFSMVSAAFLGTFPDFYSKVRLTKDEQSWVKKLAQTLETFRKAGRGGAGGLK